MAAEDTCITRLDPTPSRETARSQGYVASEDAYPISANPYPNGTIAHAWWEAGHSQATDDLCGWSNS